MEEVVRRENVVAAYKRVVRNGGAPGVDGVTVDELKAYCREHWARIREELLSDEHRPQPVRRVEIPKPGGKGTRVLGIPTVLDRMIQQALLQVLQPIFDPTFSEESYGFRPGRSPQQAVLRVKDKQVLRLIGRYLRTGMMEGGLVSPRREGTPQGGPLSPLLSNILLDELDKELERRGHRFVRYADDCNVYVKSEAAGERVMASLERFLEKRLRLKVNREKSKVTRPWKCKFLGYSVTTHREPKLRLAPESIKRLKSRLRRIWRRGRGRSLVGVIEELRPVLRGWVAYFRLVETKGSFEELDAWIRRRLRCILWRQWKRPRTRLKKLRRYGLDETRARASAYNGRGPWWNAGSSHMNQAISTSLLSHLGLVSLLHEHRRLACAS
jgi:RNA-directed DNA polymerase